MAGKKKKTEAPKVGKTNFGFALDSSGSMSPIADEIRGAYNSQLGTIKADKDLESTASLVIFGEKNGEVNAKYVNRPIAEADNLTEQNYIPSGLTPMYDGVGLLISELEKIPLAEGDANAVWIFSDGHENASKEWSGKTLKNKITKLEATGKWTFSYVGANQDSISVSKTLGMDASNSINFNATKAGMRGFDKHWGSATTAYMESRKMGETKMSNMYEGVTNASEDEDTPEVDPDFSSNVPTVRGFINK
jgi:hypothetical protein